MFQMCLRPCRAVPGSWEQTRTQLSAPQTLQSDLLSRRLRIISTSLIHTAESMSDLFCQLSWSMQSWRTGNMDTALQLGPGFQNMLVSNILEVKKEKKPETSLVTVLQQYWMEWDQHQAELTSYILSYYNKSVIRIPFHFCGRQSHLPVLCVWLLLSLSY